MPNDDSMIVKELVNYLTIAGKTTHRFASEGKVPGLMLHGVFGRADRSLD